MNKVIDLRSDTVTLPTDSMYKAMADAVLGDDVLGDDPTVKKMELNAAKLIGKEAALFVPSGTMGNLISIMVHCPRGTEIILGNKAHTFVYEAGGISAFGGIHSHQIDNLPDGTMKTDDILDAIRSDNVHFPKTACITLENTHNICNGSPLPFNFLQTVFNLARENSLKVHTDGARIFNASAALNLKVSELCEYTDTITFCLSKGLASPVGSIICGSEEFIYHARRTRKVLGGGMRQAGILASAGLISLNKMVGQLKNDHKNLKKLAHGLAEIPKIKLNPKDFKTNILYFKLINSTYSDQNFVDKMEKRGIKFFALGNNRFRLVTHSGINNKDIDKTVQVFSEILQK